MRARTKSMEVDAFEIPDDLTPEEAGSLGLGWDYTARGGRGVATTSAGRAIMPVMPGYWLVTYENGDKRVFPDAGFHEIFERIE